MTEGSIMNHLVKHRFYYSLSTAWLIVSLALSAGAAPMQSGSTWSASVGLEADLGSGRDPGDRDAGMFGAAGGPSLGFQWWPRDWFGFGGHFNYQSKTSNLGAFNSAASAWRVGATATLAAPTTLSPHLSVGMALDGFQSDWTIDQTSTMHSGTGTDRLNRLIGTAEAGLSIGYAGWSIGAHLGILKTLHSNMDSTITTWATDSANSTPITKNSVTDWTRRELSSLDINIGVRLSRCFE